MRRDIIKPSSMHAIVVPAGQFDSTPDGKQFDADENFTFNVPEDVAAFFLAQPGWGEGLNPFPPEEEAPKPKRAPKVAAE